MNFDELIRNIISEKALAEVTESLDNGVKTFLENVISEATPPLPPKQNQNQGGDEEGDDKNIKGNDGDVPSGGEDGGQFDIGADELGELDDLSKLIDEKVYPEEIELAKLAVRALYFNPSSKSTHRYVLNVDGEKIPFEKVSDYFEKTKNWKPILGFVEFVMDKFEGLASKWTEKPEIRGKGILDKIKTYTHDLPEDEQLDNGKRVYWARIILNCLLYGKATYNINMSDVNEKNIKEVYRKLKQDFGRDSRGLMPDVNIKGPGIF